MWYTNKINVGDIILCSDICYDDNTISVNTYKVYKIPHTCYKNILLSVSEHIFHYKKKESNVVCSYFNNGDKYKTYIDKIIKSLGE